MAFKWRKTLYGIQGKLLSLFKPQFFISKDGIIIEPSYEDCCKNYMKNA